MRVDKRFVIALAPLLLGGVVLVGALVYRKGISLPLPVRVPDLSSPVRRTQKPRLVEGWLSATGVYKDKKFVPLKFETFPGKVDTYLMLLPGDLPESTNQAVIVFFYRRVEQTGNLNIVLSVDWDKYEMEASDSSCDLSKAHASFLLTPYIVYVDDVEIEKGVLRKGKSLYAVSVPVEAGWHSVSILLYGEHPWSECEKRSSEMGNVSIVRYLTVKVGEEGKPAEVPVGYVEKDRFEKFLVNVEKRRKQVTGETTLIVPAQTSTQPAVISPLPKQEVKGGKQAKPEPGQPQKPRDVSEETLNWGWDRYEPPEVVQPPKPERKVRKQKKVGKKVLKRKRKVTEERLPDTLRYPSW